MSDLNTPTGNLNVGALAVAANHTYQSSTNVPAGYSLVPASELPEVPENVHVEVWKDSRIG
jgi:hypothetical protein